ncbi:ATP-binding region, ATPase-like:Histidine kinase, HAMP region:Histidine kinase A, N-terminal [[Actinomadura] parvosata subsp. kistnae]|uniref:sensor histidine kinase n=1 Tax=[Actinomadura] parvosata TaxID=1955412 RepID=UPI000D2B5B15|nr:HAMP domain-containing sensor histidine kinase [Nonomuraea sp. ATCC 55076]SPL92073.1 ATP-binding region, ATPase-like:Histidine kinase, HAMP region:Histidine kinase A, N-terminal [Actinomadura parvosata subsp. kistnae]
MNLLLSSLRSRVRPTLRLRLTLVYGAVFLLAGLVLLGVTYLLFQQQLVQTFDDRYASPAEPGRFKQLLIKQDGVTLYGDAAMEWLWRQQQELRDAAVTSLLTQGAIALVAVGGAAVGLGWWVAGRVLAPLHLVTATARKIAAAPMAERGLHERIALRGPADEVKDLADTFDTMVERLDHSFDGQRRFVANASHELRTPLTLNRALVELAMHRRTASSDVKELGESLLEINARHERLISGLLLLARSEQEVADRSPVDLADIVTHVTAQTADQAADAKITVYEVVAPAPTTGDALLLERLVHNLVENGIRYNLDDGTGWVRVVSRTVSGDKVEVEVSNTGPAVPPYDVPLLFKPFHRQAGERAVTGTSAGLGLSIVRSVAIAHGGDVRARPRDGGGLIVAVSLPRATDRSW